LLPCCRFFHRQNHARIAQSPLRPHTN
jgi:hypothetical protein